MEVEIIHSSQNFFSLCTFFCAVFNTHFSRWPAWQLCKLNFSQIASLVFPSPSNTLVFLYFSTPSILKLFVILRVSIALFQYIRKAVPWIALFCAWVHSFLYLNVFLSNGPISCFKLFICVHLSFLSTPTRLASDNTKRSFTSVTFPYLDTYILTLGSRDEFNAGCSCGPCIVQCIV
jgi:hypothetical protein